MSDMKSAIVPRSDQLNNDDLLSGPITVTITDVAIKPGEQPVSIFYEGDNGKPYKPCKSMCRVLVSAWGADASKYKGRSMTLYSDPKVTWAGMAVGGIRISHMSDIESSMTMALTVTRANKKPFTVKPLVNAPKAAPSSSPADPERPPSSGQQIDGAAPCITPEEALALEARCQENGIPLAKLKAAAKVERLSMIAPDDLPRAHQWIDKMIAKRQEAA